MRTILVFSLFLVTSLIYTQANTDEIIALETTPICFEGDSTCILLTGLVTNPLQLAELFKNEFYKNSELSVEDIARHIIDINNWKKHGVEMNSKLEIRGAIKYALNESL